VTETTFLGRDYSSGRAAAARQGHAAAKGDTRRGEHDQVERIYGDGEDCGNGVII
jgi:hypothetical protein